MSLSDKFYAVDLNGRAVLLHEHGEYLVTRTYYGRKHNLYAMPGFYVELISTPSELLAWDGEIRSRNFVIQLAFFCPSASLAEDAEIRKHLPDKLFFSEVLLKRSAHTRVSLAIAGEVIYSAFVYLINFIATTK